MSDPTKPLEEEADLPTIPNVEIDLDEPKSMADLARQRDASSRDEPPVEKEAAEKRLAEFYQFPEGDDRFSGITRPSDSDNATKWNKYNKAVAAAWSSLARENADRIREFENQPPPEIAPELRTKIDGYDELDARLKSTIEERERLSTEMARFDLQRDPRFQSEIIAPFNELRTKAHAAFSTIGEEDGLNLLRAMDAALSQANTLPEFNAAIAPALQESGLSPYALSQLGSDLPRMFELKQRHDTSLADHEGTRGTYEARDSIARKERAGEFMSNGLPQLRTRINDTYGDHIAAVDELAGSFLTPEVNEKLEAATSDFEVRARASIEEGDPMKLMHYAEMGRMLPKMLTVIHSLSAGVKAAQAKAEAAEAEAAEARSRSQKLSGGKAIPSAPGEADAGDAPKTMADLVRIRHGG
jgi:hypothetical protein